MATAETVDILVVDDSPGKLLALTAALADLGENIVTAQSGREALRQVMSRDFALILLDVNMPDMDGFETAHLIRERKSSSQTPIIFITAYGDDTHATHGYSLGAVDYLLTPVVPEVLRTKAGVFVELYKKNAEIRRQAQQSIALAQEQAARRAAETANRIKDEFLAILSHELRTPLTAILGWTHLLRMAPRNENDVTEGLETIERNAKLQARIIEDLLDVSRIISGKLQLDLQPTSLAAVCDAALATVQSAVDARRIVIEKRVAPHLPTLHVDATRIQQVITNLVSNAVKFSPEGGRVSVVAERVESEVDITVSDSGIGIDPQFLPYVFERFRQADASTTRRSGGLGLGLAIVRQLIEMHGGSVSVNSGGQNQGSQFTVRLPIVAIEESATTQLQIYNSERSDSPTRSLAGIRILVVDDEPDTRAVLKRALDDQDAEVVTADCVDRALGIIAQAKPNLVITDIGMPERDGYDLIRELRSRYSPSELPVMALTAYAREEDKSRTAAAGFQLHLAKPVDLERLISAVGKLTSSAVRSVG